MINPKVGDRVQFSLADLQDRYVGYIMTPEVNGSVIVMLENRFAHESFDKNAKPLIGIRVDILEKEG